MSDAPTTTFYEAYPLKDLRPADYNPRHLSEEAFARLQESIKRHGIVKPVILNADGTLVAGHQRTKAMTALGMTHTPAVMLGTKVRRTDEIQFNLLHNRVETEASIVYAQPGPIGKWSWIPWQTIEVAESRNKPFQQAISYMTGGHGAWGSVVIDDQGQIALNAEYAVVAAKNHFDVLAWTCPSLDAAAQIADRPVGMYRAGGDDRVCRLRGNPSRAGGLGPTDAPGRGGGPNPLGRTCRCSRRGRHGTRSCRRLVDRESAAAGPGVHAAQPALRGLRGRERP
ncbi:ParB N-terminal domain-containing protein [Streptomyces sp. NPDC001982]|uniref:ParB N-terminal domain-containing protein n=1 Tax=Streptomyces sp. NPDC001982 TaxID=3154405 RepID=UPI00332393B3